jgi:deoxyribonuclease IV
MDIGIHNDDYLNIEKAIQKVIHLKINCLQIFLGSKSLTTLSEKWKPSKIEIKNIKEKLTKYKIHLFIHGMLRINFCNDPSQKRYYWGLQNLIYDMKLGNQLGAKGVVIHAGHLKTKFYDISKKKCINHFIQSLVYVLDNTQKINIYLETPATQNNTFFSSLEELANLFKQIPKKYQTRIGICIDTCHIFVNGYNISTKQGVIDYFNKFEKLIGLKHLKLIHINDSKGQFDSHINRHNSIGQGYIFKEQKEGLIQLLYFIKKYKLPIILETNQEYFTENIKIIHKYENNKEIKNMNNKKNLIIRIFEDLLHYYKTLGNKNNSSTLFRIQSYEKIIKELYQINKISSLNNIKNVNGLGQKTLYKINTILKSNHLPLHNKLLQNKDKNKINILKNLQNIYGVGPQISQTLYEKGIITIEQLKKNVKQKKIILSNAQTLGLEYYNDLKIRIPYDEITETTKIIKKELKKYNKELELLNAGSYAMKKKNSGDIDYILIFDPSKIKLNIVKETFNEILIKKKWIKGHLLDGKNKDIFLIHILKKNPVRHLDIGYVPIHEKYFYILYFSSSRDFSKKIRLHASKKGYKLNEKGLFDKKSGKQIDFQPKNEKEIFEYLEFLYVKPENRK